MSQPTTTSATGARNSAKSLIGWKHFLNRENLEKDAIVESGGASDREVTRLEETDEAIKRSAREELAKLQAGYAENFAIWKETVELSWREFEKLYNLLDIRFDGMLSATAPTMALWRRSARNSKNAG
jgi:arginyl-tRNA synthetase